MFDQLDPSVTALKENTLKSSVSCEGIGLHTGRTVKMSLVPAPAGTGIVFRRLDLLTCDSLSAQPASLSKISVKASPAAVRETQLGTTLANEHGISISTTEHLMAAFAGVGIDNVFVEVEGPEIPIMDGSSEPFLALIDQAGLRPLPAPRRALRIVEEISVRDGDRWITIVPNRDENDTSCDIDILVEYRDPAIGKQRASFVVNPNTFRENVASARTFCNLKDVETMRARGLALGGSYDNAIVVNEGKVENEGGLRFDREFVYHKALDLIGDLFLLGHPLIGRISAYKPGHDLNTQLARAIADNPQAVVIETIPADEPEELFAHA